MKKRLIVVAIVMSGLTVAWAAGPTGFYDALRGDTPILEEPQPPPLGNPENKDIKRGRAYAMQPPTIPHKTDNYQIDLNANKCMLCHSRIQAAESQAPPVSVSHYMDRDGNFLAEILPRRYFCEQCHVVQMEAKPLVESTFEDVDTILKREQAKQKPPKK